MQTFYRGKKLFEASSKQDRFCRKPVSFLRCDLKRSFSMTNSSDSHVLYFHRGILVEFLMRKRSELVRFDSISCQKSMRLLRHSISWLILIKHHDTSPGSPQDKRSI